MTDRLLGPLFTDLYELTMAAGYAARDMRADATFSMFVRACPERNYFVAAGLADALEELAALRFTEADRAYLTSTGLFPDAFLDRLEALRFTGRVRAMPEGTLFFPDEPILEVTAPIPEAQIVETALLNRVGFASLIATKAARCVDVAGGRPLIDFSLRRTQGADAGMQVARSTHIAGFSGTSNVLAGKRYGIPISGTMAHSFVQAFADEEAAFVAYADTFPDQSVFLIDTYDTREGARCAAKVAAAMAKRGAALKGVRLDSGDMAALSRDVRRILDRAGFPGVQIFASSGFDEFKIARVLAEGAAIDAFGVGTHVGVSADAPSLDIVYKLVRFDGRDVRKMSTGKATLAGEKQVFRRIDTDGRFEEDIIGRWEEQRSDAVPLLDVVMEGGTPIGPPPSLEQIRERVAVQVAALDARYRSITEKAVYPVGISRALEAIQPVG